MTESDQVTRVLQEIGTGVALADVEDWTITFENARFFQWCPPDGDADAPLSSRIPDFKAERAAQRVRGGRVYRQEFERRDGARTTWLAVEARALADDPETAIVECRDITAQRQAEYMLESYSEVSERNTRELQKEKERVEKLLLNIMPRSVYEEMKDYGTSTPQRFERATIMLLDFIGFTDMAVQREPGELVTELNDIFSAFDRIVELFGCERIKTMGDAYMAVSGVPEQTPDHAHNIARAALRIRRYLERRNAAHARDWTCRIGISTGPVVGSIVGIQKYVYDIFGPGVNLAARMEALADPMGITMCETTHALLHEDFKFSQIGEEDIKGFGPITLYALEGERDRNVVRRESRF